MESSRPVDCNVRRLLVELDSTGDTAATGQLAELVETVEHRTILTNVKPLQQLAVLAHVVWPDRPEKPDVVITVKLRHLILSRFMGPVDLHLSVESIVEEQVVGHPHAVGLHWVTLSIVVVANVRVIVVADLGLTVLLHPRSSLFS